MVRYRNKDPAQLAAQGHLSAQGLGMPMEREGGIMNQIVLNVAARHNEVGGED